MTSLTVEERYLLNAIGAVVLKSDIPTPPADIDEVKLYNLAVRHSVANLLYKAVTKRREFSQKLKTALLEYSDKALYLDALQQTEFELIAKALMMRKISFTPLKGIIVKRFYPCTDMRVMSDIDILISPDDRETVKEIMVSLGFKDGGTLSYQDIYSKPNGITVEIHFALWGYDLEKTSLWKKLTEPSSTYFRALSNEDIYVFMLVHIAKHFKTSGIGIRAFIDAVVFLRAVSGVLKREYIDEQLKILDLNAFEKTVFRIIDICFTGAESDDVYNEMIEYILHGETHGAMLQGSINKIALESVGEPFAAQKAARILKMAFPPLDYMKRRYQKLEKYPFLLPFYWLKRPFSALSSKYGGVGRKIEEINNVNKDDVEKMRRIFAECGFISVTAAVTSEEKCESETTNTLSLAASVAVCVMVAGLLIALIVFVSVFYERETSGAESEDSVISDTTSEDMNISLETIIPEGSEYKEIVWKNGTYTGYIVNGVPNGSGTLVYGNGEKYIGGFIDGEYNGEGVYYYLGGSRYVGGFLNGKLSGNGTLYYESGDVISGTFLNGMPNGICIYMYANGDVYDGMLVNGVRHGEGKFSWANGDVYEGTFVNGFRSGYGEYSHKKGGSYKGEWENGKQNGIGVYEDDKCKYEGTFVDGLYEGEGKMTWANGDVYLGGFVSGEMTDTSATFTYKDGTKYTGGFLNGLYSGQGLLEYADGDKVKGTFEKGKLNGKAEYYFKATGEWKNVTYTNGQITSYD